MPNYHLGFASHMEVMFRNPEDMNHWFNCFCSALYKTDSVCYAESTMSDHNHNCTRTKQPGELIRIARDSYNKYFNNKYSRKGPLGEKGVYIVEIEGLNHLLAELSYTLRNSVHHGITSTPFEYQYSSVNCYFMKQLGKEPYSGKLLNPRQIQSILPRRAEYDPAWKMSEEGVFLRESVMDIAAVETSFGTARAFNYYMGRKSGEEWKKEQMEDGSLLPPVTLESFERGFSKKGPSEESFAKMLRNESARIPVFRITDLDLCHLIDTEYVPRFSCESVYHLSETQKQQIANELLRKYHPGHSQLRRCLII